MNENEILEKIREIMKSNGVSQRQVAKEFEISENYVNQMLGIGKSKRRNISDEIPKKFGFFRIEIYKEYKEENVNGISGTIPIAE